MSKTITIKTNVYLDLLDVKRKNESFSNLFERLIKPKNPADILKEIRGSVEFKNKDKMLSEIYLKRSEKR